MHFYSQYVSLITELGTTVTITSGSVSVHEPEKTQFVRSKSYIYPAISCQKIVIRENI